MWTSRRSKRGPALVGSWLRLLLGALRSAPRIAAVVAIAAAAGCGPPTGESPPPPGGVINCKTFPVGAVGSTYQFTPEVVGGSGNYTQWTATNLPPGLSIDADTGTISGVPVEAATYGGITISTFDSDTGETLEATECGDLVIKAITWQATYGTPGVDHRGYSVDVTTSGHYFVTGSSAAGAEDLYALQVRADGTMAWSQTYGTKDHRDVGTTVRQTSDGGYIYGGATESFGGRSQMWVFKLSAGGDTLWDEVRGYPSEDEYAVTVRQTQDGGYIAAGFTTAGAGDIFLLKLGPAGGVEWYDTKGYSDKREYPRSIEQTSDGGYIVVGSQNAACYMLKVGALGATEWYRTCPPDSGAATSVQQTADGGYVVLFDAPPRLEKTDANGNMEWGISFDSALSLTLRSVQLTTDGGYIVAGDYFDDVLLWKFSALGKNWMKVYGGELQDEGYEVQQTADGGYIVVGSTEVAAGVHQVWLIKTDANGDVAGLASKL